MANKLDYSVQLADIAAPTESKSGEILKVAGAVEGQAASLRGKADAFSTEAQTGLTTFLGTTAIEAVKGKMKADVATDIKDALDKLEGVGPTAVAAETALTQVRSPEFVQGVAKQLATFEETGGTQAPQMVQQFMTDIRSYVDAQKQGILTREEVLTRVAASVKKHSAAMPGWAGEFRKVGAEMTGISNVDVLGIHTALTTKNAREKAQERMEAARIEAIKTIAATEGVLPDQVTPAMLQNYHHRQQLDLAVKNAENQMKLVTLDRTQADEAFGQIVDMKIAGAIVSFGEEFAKLGALNADTTKAVEASAFGLQLSTRVAMLGTQLESEIRNMTRPSMPVASVGPVRMDARLPAQTPMSVEAAEKRIAAVRSTIKELQEGVKNVEGRNMLAAIVKNAENNLTLLTTNFQLANPYIAGLNKLNLLPSGIVQAWVTLPPEEFRKRFGKEIADAFENVKKNPQQHASLMVSAAMGGPVNLPAIATADPGLATVTATDMVNNLKVWAADKAPTEPKKIAYANTFAAFYSNRENFHPGVPRNIESAYSILSNPDTQQFFGKLSDPQRQAALGPLVAGVESTVRQYTAQVQEELAKWNDTSTNPAARSGVTLSVEQDSLTGMLKVVESREPGAGGVTMVGTEGGGVYGARTGAFTGVARGNARAARARLEELVGQTNKLVETYTLGARLINPALNTNIEAVRQRAYIGFSTGNWTPLEPGVAAMFAKQESGKTNAPKNAPTTLDNLLVLRGIEAAERSKDSDVGAAGERGRYQIRVETAKELGLKVDPDSGVDERVDPVKAGPAVVKYVSQHFDTFGGDIRKAVAAYNAGASNVKKAVEKAEKLGSPDLWQAFLPKPDITVPYIKRFMGAYETTPIRR